MEWIDILNGDGEPTLERGTKPEVHSLGLWHASAHVWITHPGGQILMQRRSFQKENDPGLWDVSVAGHLNAGEKPIEAALRETKEEIGLDLTAADLHDLDRRFRVERFLNEGAYIDREWQYLFWAVCDLPLDAFRLQEEEVAELAWVNPEWLAEFTARRDPELVPHWQQYEYILKFLEKHRS
jgi:isopentenyldiphosphate isomerase